MIYLIFNIVLDRVLQEVLKLQQMFITDYWQSVHLLYKDIISKRQKYHCTSTFNVKYKQYDIFESQQPLTTGSD